MVDFSPNWDAIAQAFIARLKEIPGITTAFDRYPDNPISRQDLACAVIREPDFEPSAVTFGAVTVAYTGELNIPVLKVSTGQAELSKSDANRCRNLGLNVQVHIHGNRRLIVGNTNAYLSLGQASTARLTPNFLGGSKVDYAGLVIPYTITIQYASK